MTCKLISYYVPDYPASGLGTGTAKLVTKCETHEWTFETPIVKGMCPMGRIEKAIDDGLTRIAQAIGGTDI